MTQVYGGWRERRGFGVVGMSGPQTAVALAVITGLLASLLLAPAVTAYFSPLAVLAAAGILIRVRGESLVSVITRHGRWATRGRRGIELAGLPAPLSGIRLIEIASTTSVSAVWDADRESVTAVVPLEPTGLEFVDQEEVSQWVRSWSDWLAHLGYLPDVRHVVVTVETGPRVESVVTGFEPAPTLLEQMAGSAGPETVARTCLSITVACPRQQLDVAGDRLLEVLATADALGRCGLTVLPALSDRQLAAWVRSALDPKLEVIDCAWTDAHATAIQEHWASYQHESGVSAGFTWDEAPGQAIPVQVLQRLLGVSKYRKRVAMVFEPVPAHLAAREVDRQAEAAAFRRQYRRRIGRDETARDVADLERAQQTAREQATGAGLVDVGLYAVVTAHSADQLEMCAIDLLNRAGESRIRLRRSYGNQAAVFAASLGLGFVPERRW